MINFAHLLGLYFVMEDFIDRDREEKSEYDYLDSPEEDEEKEDSFLLDEETEFHF